MKTAALALLTTLCLAAPAAADVPVPGSDLKVSETRNAQVGGKAVSLKLTGVGLREKAFINVYAIAGYVDGAAAPHSATELASADVPKQMVLTLERDVEGGKMADAMSEAIRANYPSGMDSEVSQLEGFLKSHPLGKGDEVIFTWLPHAGVVCEVRGQGNLTLKNPAFAKAVWDIWLGGTPVQKDIKKGLVSRL